MLQVIEKYILCTSMYSAEQCQGLQKYKLQVVQICQIYTCLSKNRSVTVKVDTTWVSQGIASVSRFHNVDKNAFKKLRR